MSRPLKLSQNDRDAIRAIVRDRQGMEMRRIEIETELQALVEELEGLRAQIHAISNVALASKFEVAPSTICDLLHGRIWRE